MSRFNENDMKNYMSNLGESVVTSISDIQPDREMHFVDDLTEQLKKSRTIPADLLARYGALVTLMKRGDKLDIRLQKALIVLVKTALNQLCEELDRVRALLETMDNDQLVNLQKFVGVVIWLTWNLLEEFHFARNVRKVTFNDKAKNKRKPIEYQQFWIDGRNALLESLNNLFQFNFMRIWDNNLNMINKKIFVELILGAVLHAVKYGGEDILHFPELCGQLATLLGHFCIKVEMDSQVAVNLAVNVVQSEDVALATAKILAVMISNGCPITIIRKSVAKCMDLTRNPRMKDKSAELSAFLLELTELIPVEFKKHSLVHVIQLVNSPVVAFRNVLQAICVVLLQTEKERLIKENEGRSDDDLRFRRKLILLIGETFCRDVNVTVRSKAVVLGTKILESNGLFNDEIYLLATMMRETLTDLNQTVRKHAFNFFKMVVHFDPVAAKFEPKDIQKLLQEKSGALVQERLNFVKSVCREAKINICVTEFLYQIESICVKEVYGNRLQGPELTSPRSAYTEIKRLAQELKFWEACELLFAATTKFGGGEMKMNDSLDYFNNYLRIIGTGGNMDYYELERYHQDHLDVLETVTPRNKNDRLLLSHLYVSELMSTLIMERVIPISLKVMKVGLPTDRVEGLSFLAKIASYGYDYPKEVQIEILKIMYSLSLTTNSVLDSFLEIFLKGPGSDTVFGRTKLLVAFYASIGKTNWCYAENTTAELFRTKRMHKEELKVLWDITCLKVPQMQHSDSKIAVRILQIFAKMDPTALRNLREPLIETTLRERGMEDMHFAHQGLLTLLAIIGPAQNDEADLETDRFPEETPLFAYITQLITHGLEADVDVKHYQGVVEVGISLIYNRCVNPDKTVQHLVNQCYPRVFSKTLGNLESTEAGASVPQFRSIDELLLYKILILSGAILAGHSVYHTRLITEEVKKRKAFIKIDASRKDDKTKRRLRRSFMERTSGRLAGENAESLVAETTADSIMRADQEELEAVIGNIGFDKELDLARSFLDNLADNGLMKFLWNFASYLSKRFVKIRSPKVRIGTVNLLCQAMLISAKSMDLGMQMFLKIYKASKEPLLKIRMLEKSVLFNQNYPNKTEEFNKLILEELCSNSVGVRTIALNCIVHLTNIDIIQIRSVLTDTVECLGDDNAFIRQTAVSFLEKCREKDTMLHSLIPDVIIRLSSNPKIGKEKFQIIIRGFLLPFKKVTEIISIVDKLLDRFNSVIMTVEAAEDNAYCLSILNYNDRCFKLVRDRFDQYAKLLGSMKVYEAFRKIVNNAKHNCKGDIKTVADSYLAQIEEAKEKYINLINR